ncbi:MAG TPA: tRNA preQ1(34) S-adenosylmethionine ribosyltransferase-isomerase QueA [Stellaceae bacterium]|nr:tRNA preQ1(34) S-adenosylmethionine ribosyltransferase-isomerase QueA [Stellaceae bacterium]
MRVDLFDFDLPPALIAQRPAEPRDHARLLTVTAGGLEDRQILDLPGLLARGDLLVFNDTRVLPARLTGVRGAARISITLHRRVGGDCWRAFARPAKRLKPGDRIAFAPDFAATVSQRFDDGEVELVFDRGDGELLDALHAHGAMPLPPYIRGGVADERDRDDYQTLFARVQGAVAAPTAALHFTPALMNSLAERGIRTTTLTLHVGAGTFLPVKAEDTTGHRMHEEIGTLPVPAAAAIARARLEGGKVVAVGTTSLRLIETAADQDGTVRPFSGVTRLFVTPGYRFRAVDRLLTNFHLPRSTLFMLVAAFAGLERMKSAYGHAVAGKYRFYSYGDACLLDRIPG